MKLSIWHQFSSNHSANFAIIGIFETPEKARQALSELRNILESIRRWYRDPENKSGWDNGYLKWDQDKYDMPPVGPIETEIAQKYGIEWKHAVEWFIEDYNLGLFMRDDTILLSNALEVDTDPGPLDQLMERLGARLAVDTAEVGGDTLIGVVLSCDAPDEATASKIFSAASRQLANPDSEDVYVPWGTVHRSGTVERDGLTLTFTGLTFDIFDAAFPAMVEWLEKHGFTDIEYDFQTVPDPDVWTGQEGLT